MARVPLRVARKAAAAGSSVIAIDAKSGGVAGLPRVAVACDCVETERATRGLARARIPARYEHCDFASFEADVYEGPLNSELYNQSLAQAKLILEGFARDYPLTLDAGLLLMGPCGCGKTHLAVAVMKQLIARGHDAIFYDYCELLKEIQGSYNPTNQATESSVLEPVLNTEVLLLDDLGANKPSAWALETIGHILTTRYNEKRITIITTNYLDVPVPGLLENPIVTEAANPAGNQTVDLNDTFAARRAGRPRKFRLPSGEDIPAHRDDSLTERIGGRIRSRLYEMCRTVEIQALDFRKEIRKASNSRP